jgi:hypothetical protein
MTFSGLTITIKQFMTPTDYGVLFGKAVRENKKQEHCEQQSRIKEFEQFEGQLRTQEGGSVGFGGRG